MFSIWPSGRKSREKASAVKVRPMMIPKDVFMGWTYVKCPSWWTGSDKVELRRPQRPLAAPVGDDLDMRRRLPRPFGSVWRHRRGRCQPLFVRIFKSLPAEANACIRFHSLEFNKLQFQRETAAPTAGRRFISISEADFQSPRFSSGMTDRKFSAIQASLLDFPAYPARWQRPLTFLFPVAAVDVAGPPSVLL